MSANEYLLNNKYFFTDQLTENQEKELLILYSKEWWCKTRSEDDVKAILNGSSFIIAVIESETLKLIGFARILTDYFKTAHIYDVIVHEEYRGQNLGKIIIKTIINHHKLKNIKNLELTCLEDMVPFYEKYNFTNDYGFSVPMRRCNSKSTVDQE